MSFTTKRLKADAKAERQAVLTHNNRTRGDAKEPVDDENKRMAAHAHVMTHHAFEMASPDGHKAAADAHQEVADMHMAAADELDDDGEDDEVEEK